MTGFRTYARATTGSAAKLRVHPTLEDAKAFAEAVFSKTGVIIGIEAVPTFAVDDRVVAASGKTYRVAMPAPVDGPSGTVVVVGLRALLPDPETGKARFKDFGPVRWMKPESLAKVGTVATVGWKKELGKDIFVSVEG